MIKQLSEKEYQTLLALAIPELKNHPNIDASDIVADIVLKGMEAEELLYFHDIKKLLNKSIKRYIHQTIGISILHHRTDNIKFSKSEQVKACTKCKEPKPIGEFNVVTRKINGDAFTGTKEILPYCKDCQRSAAKEQSIRRKNGESSTVSRKKAQNKYQAKVRKNRSLADKRAYNDKMREYHIKRKVDKKKEEWL